MWSHTKCTALKKMLINMTTVNINLMARASCAVFLLPLVEPQKKLTANGLAICLQHAHPKTCN